MTERKKCFYCRQPLKQHPHKDGAPQRWDQQTRDHVIPRSLLRKLKISGKVKGNHVDCCARCNGFKGDRNPLEMFVYLSDETAKKLRDKLVAIGVPEAIVHDAYTASRDTTP